VIGAVIGDIVGSVYEHGRIQTTFFPLFSQYSRFTDDTVLTIALADAILQGRGYADSLRKYARKYPNAGYGFNFFQWAFSVSGKPYGSWGNGSAMRVSPVGYAFSSLEEVLFEAKKSAEVTHNHREGIKGAQAVAACVFLARNGHTKAEMKTFVEERFGYELKRTCDEIRPEYRFDVSCQGSVPESIICFLESDGVIDAVRNAVSLGGDSDTMACIAGSIAEAFYKKIPREVVEHAKTLLTPHLLGTLEEFEKQYGVFEEVD
jgi:ADP-ribosylglycohydrolase